MSEKMERFSQRARRVLTLAEEEAERLQHNYIGTAHILIGLVREEGGVAGRVLRELGIDQPQVEELLERMSRAGTRTQNVRPDLSPGAKKVIELAVDEARRMGHHYIGTEHLLLGLVRQNEGIAIDILKGLNTSPEEIRRNVRRMLQEKTIPADPQRPVTPVSSPYSRPQSSPLLDQLAVDLTALARKNQLDTVVGRDGEIMRIVEILSRRENNGVLLIGAPGVGKTAIPIGIAQRIIDGTAPAWFLDKRIVRILPSALIGTMNRGQFDERLRRIMEEAQPEHVVLFLDQAQMLTALKFESETALSELAGARMSNFKRWSAAEILKPALENGSINLIGAMTHDEYIELMQVDPVLARRFQTIRISEPSIDEAIQIAQAIKSNYEAYHQVKITDPALEAAVHLSFRFLPATVLHGKAISLIDEAASRVHLHPSLEADPQVTTQDVAKVVALVTGKSISEINDTDAK